MSSQRRSELVGLCVQSALDGIDERGAVAVLVVGENSGAGKTGRGRDHRHRRSASAVEGWRVLAAGRGRQRFQDECDVARTLPCHHSSASTRISFSSADTSRATSSAGSAGVRAVDSGRRSRGDVLEGAVRGESALGRGQHHRGRAVAVQQGRDDAAVEEAESVVVLGPGLERGPDRSVGGLEALQLQALRVAGPAAEAGGVGEEAVLDARARSRTTSSSHDQITRRPP